MGYLVDSLRALGTTFKNVFRKPVTWQFPEQVRPRPERYRTSFALPNDEHGELACIACLACEKICPSAIIKMKVGPKRESPATGKKRSYPDEFTLDLNACIYCELCVQVCPCDAIIMLKLPEEPTYSREALVLDKERLIANAVNRPHSWGTGEKLMAMQEAKEKKAAPAKVEAAAAPAPGPAAPVVAAAAASTSTGVSGGNGGSGAAPPVGGGGQ